MFQKNITNNSKAFPVLSDGAVRVTPFTEKHLSERYVSWLNDPVVVRYSEQRHRSHTKKTCESYYLQQQNTANYFLAIEIEEDKSFRHVGNIGVATDLNNHTADMSILVGDRRVWGRGVGSRAWISVMRTLLDILDFRIITAGTMSVNKPMLALFNRSGMKTNATIPGRFMWEGMEVDLIMASISQSMQQKSNL